MTEISGGTETRILVAKHDLSNRVINLTQLILYTAAETKISDVLIRKEVQAAMKISPALICMFENSEIGDVKHIPIAGKYIDRASAYFTKELGRKVRVEAHPSILEQAFFEEVF
jgi:hypothetical protein